MPFIGTVEGRFGYGMPVQVNTGPDPYIISGNATTSVSITGSTAIPGVAGQDDSFGYIPTDSTFNFFFFGTNYGNGAANSIYWNTNNVLGFGTGNGTITWAANTGRGVLIGNFDRRCDTNAYYFPITVNGDFRILRCLMFFRNIYNAGVANEGQIAVRLMKNVVTGLQYIEVRVFKGSGGANSGAITSTGGWNITDGTTFKNTYGSTFNSTFPADNTSYVLASDANGNTWTFYNTSYVNA